MNQPGAGFGLIVAIMLLGTATLKSQVAIPEILEKGGTHMKSGGRAFILKGEKEKPVEHQGFVLEDTIGYELPVISKSYKLFIYKKVS